MRGRFVIEAIMLAVHGQMLVPPKPVEYIIPYSTVVELYDFKDSKEPIMHDELEEKYVRASIEQMIDFFEQPFNKKKLGRALQVPWKKSPPLPVNHHVTLTIIHALDHEQLGAAFDPVETELILTAFKERIPIISDHFELYEKLISEEIAVRVYDIEDFEFAVERADMLYEAD